MEDKDRTITIAIIIGVIALLLGCCLGAAAGAAGGYLLGHQASSRPAQRFGPLAPNPPSTPELPALPELLGKQGALIQEVIAGSPAEAAGIEISDIITEVDGTPVDANHRLVDLVSQYQPGDRITLTLSRGGETKRITVTLGAGPQNNSRPYLGVRYADLAGSPDQSAPGD